MSAGSSKHVSRRHLIALVGGAAGVLATKRATAAVSETRSTADVAAATAPVAPEARPWVEGAAQPSAPSGEWVEANALPSGPQARPLSVPVAGETVLGLFAGLRPGSRIGRWTVDAIHDLHLGAVPVVLSTADGARFQVDVVRRDASAKGPRGIASAGELDFFLSNAGTGLSATAEEQGLATMALAAWVGRTAVKAPRGLLTLKERNARFPGAGFGVLA